MFNLSNRPISCKTTKRQLGKILVDGDFVTPDHIKTALEQQKQTNEQLGEILIRSGVLSPFELKAVLSIQTELACPEDALKAAAGARLLLGEILLRAKRISREQLDCALSEQKRTGDKLGTVLIRLGLLTETELKAALAFQLDQDGEAPVLNKLRLGEILVTTGQISRTQLEDVLNRQKMSKKKIGELLVEAGYLEAQQVDYTLKLQQKLLTAALIAALSMSSMLGDQEAHAMSSGVSTKINIAATVLPHTSITVLSQVPELVVTNIDIKRGYIEVPSATRISVKSNNPAGYLLAFEPMGAIDSFFTSVNVLIAGREMQLSPNGAGWVPQPYIRGGVIQNVNYRFALSKNAQPGTYNWPLMISVHHI